MVLWNKIKLFIYIEVYIKIYLYWGPQLKISMNVKQISRALFHIDPIVYIVFIIKVLLNLSLNFISVVILQPVRSCVVLGFSHKHKQIFILGVLMITNFVCAIFLCFGRRVKVIYLFIIYLFNYFPFKIKRSNCSIYF